MCGGEGIKPLNYHFELTNEAGDTFLSPGYPPEVVNEIADALTELARMIWWPAAAVVIVQDNNQGVASIKRKLTIHDTGTILQPLDDMDKSDLYRVKPRVFVKTLCSLGVAVAPALFKYLPTIRR